MEVLFGRKDDKNQQLVAMLMNNNDAILLSQVCLDAYVIANC